MDTAFVTGATGFLGINLIQELTGRGWKVYALHRKSSNLEYLNRFPVEKVVGDITDLASLQTAVPEGIDVLFHLAASTNLWSKHNELQRKINVEGTQNVIQVALEKKVKRMVHTSSAAAYGFHKEIVQEDTPSTAMESDVNYCITKYQAEELVKKAVRDQGLHAVILNPGHIMGPYDLHNWIQMIILVHKNKLPGIPSGMGDFSHVNEIVKAHVAAAEKGNIGENYLLGGQHASFLDVINLIQKRFGRKLSKSATSDAVLKLGLGLSKMKSWFSSKEPELTPEKFKLLTARLMMSDGKAQTYLGFRHRPVEELIHDTVDWLEKENLLTS
ncbi:MAG: SDR family oxidoreductase [Saprospiraceae bacterium]|nr:SDR family oxidoreductase [Saprospiraceae bacterium]